MELLFFHTTATTLVSLSLFLSGENRTGKLFSRVDRYREKLHHLERVFIRSSMFQMKLLLVLINNQRWIELLRCGYSLKEWELLPHSLLQLALVCASTGYSCSYSVCLDLEHSIVLMWSEQVEVRNLCFEIVHLKIRQSKLVVVLQCWEEEEKVEWISQLKTRDGKVEYIKEVAWMGYVIVLHFSSFLFLSLSLLELVGRSVAVASFVYTI